MTDKSRLEVKDNGLCVLHNVNASWPKLDKPDGIEGTPEDQLKYSIQVLLRIEDPVIAEFKELVKSKLPKDFGKPSADKLPFREVSEKLPETWEDASAFRITAKAKFKPKTFDAKGTAIDALSIHAGDRVSIAFTVWPVQNKFGAFIQLQLQAVMRISADLDFGGNGPDVGAEAFGVTPKAKSIDPFDDDIGF